MSIEERAIRCLIHFAACAHDAMDNSEELPDGTSVIGKPYWEALCAALDILNELPDDRPGYIMSPPAKAQWALHNVAAGLARAEGWQLVPVEPDANMLDIEAYPRVHDTRRNLWRAMLSVAPSLTAGQRGEP